MTGIEDVKRALEERAPLRRADAEVWREEIPPEDSAPPWEPETPSPTTWGRTQAEAREMLRRQMCPVCGEGPWKSPLNHAAKRHGILKHELREACGLNMVESVAAPDFVERLSQREKARDRDMQELARRSRKNYRMTTAGRSKLAANLTEWEQANPEAALDQRGRAGRKGAAARWGES